jgi:gas vesicle protein
MAENNHSCVGGMISAFFSGALLGAGLALLFAPVTGKEARHTIVQQFDELKEKFRELEKKMHKSGINDSINSEDEEEVGA